MAQPICVMYVPEDFSFSRSSEIVNTNKLMRELNGWYNNNVSPERDSLGGYLWFVFFKESIREPELKVFYDKDFTPIQYEELKQMVFDNFNK